MEAIVKTDFHFPKQKSVYKGKVRDVYNINDEYLVMLVSDRISAFDVVLPKGIRNFWMPLLTSFPIGKSLRPILWLLSAICASLLK